VVEEEVKMLLTKEVEVEEQEEELGMEDLYLEDLEIHLAQTQVKEQTVEEAIQLVTDQLVGVVEPTDKLVALQLIIQTQQQGVMVHNLV
jgi:hypothetical protein